MARQHRYTAQQIAHFKRRRQGANVFGALKTRNIKSWEGYRPGNELKFSDSENNADAFAVTWATMVDGTMNCLSAVAQGVGESQRLGRKYWISSIHLKLNIIEPAKESQAGPISDTQLRLILVLDTQTNATIINATDVVDTGQTADILSFRNLQQTGRFRVLWDRKIVMPIINQTNEGAVNKFAAGTTVRLININKKFKRPIAVECEGTGATVTDISTNSISLIGISNVVTTTLTYQCRIRFRG